MWDASPWWKARISHSWKVLINRIFYSACTRNRNRFFSSACLVSIYSQVGGSVSTLKEVN